jgi:IS5 family transposase
MAQKQVGQLGFADHMVSDVGRRSSGTLERIDLLVDWPGLEKVMGNLYPSAKGERAFPPLVMLKILLLQCWHGLSDPEMEAALDDRLSFRRFAGLAVDDQVPDHATIWRFRQRLADRGLDGELLAEVARQIDAAGLIVRRGTLIDASLVASAARRPRMDEGKTSPADPDARFGANNERGRFSFGYKMHLAVDDGSALVREALLTPANIQEIDMAMDLVQGDETNVFADRGYDSGRLHDYLKSFGIVDGVMRRASKGKPLSEAETNRNHAIAAIRKAVEKVFGTLKLHYGLSRMRYFTQARNAVRFRFCVIGYNLRRMMVLMHA